VITFTLLCGYSPFRSEDRDELIEECVKCEVTFHKSYWKGVSEDAKEFILSLLRSDPASRLTAKAALKHRWIAGDVASTTDLLPTVKEGFNARKKFRHAVEAIRLTNRIKSLSMGAEEDDSDKEAEAAPELHKTLTSGSRFAEIVRAASMRKAEEESETGSK
jgi:calcium/calmodulin-dependent protein kinase I